MDLSNLENLLLDYMKVESTTGNEALGAFAKLVVKGLEAGGWHVQIQPVENTTRVNLLATLVPITTEYSPRLIFNTHLDTVPPYIPPSEDENNIYGRGSYDAKGQVVCMVSAANELAKENPEIAKQIGLLFVVGEEVDHIGMQYANDFANLKPDYLIVGEPTELKFATIQKGALKVILYTEGVAGHSGYPSSGISAIHKLVPILNDIINYKWPEDSNLGATTFNIGFIDGGQAHNAWAERASAKIFFRVTTSVADINKRLEQIVSGRALIEITNSNEPVMLSDTPLDVPTDQVAFNTDLPYYNKIEKLRGHFHK